MPGEQLIRLIFDSPLHLKQIRLVFHEAKVQRTQEFSLSWSAVGGGLREIVPIAATSLEGCAWFRPSLAPIVA